MASKGNPSATDEHFRGVVSDLIEERVSRQNQLAADTPQGSLKKSKWLERLLSFASVVLGLGDDFVTFITANAIKPKKVQWLWPDRIPLGKLTLFVGNPDNGKSLAAMNVAALVTTGRDWYEAKNTVPPSDVLIFACEDDPEDTAVPRLMAAGADLARIYFGNMSSDAAQPVQKERQMRLDKDVAAIKKTLAENRNIRLIFIDPVSNYLGQTKMVDEQSVRQVLAPLQNLASETGVAIVGIMHLNKKQDLNVISRIGGAMAFVGVARAVWLFVADEDSPGIFHMLRVKNNIADRGAGGLLYRIATKYVEIEGEGVPEPYVEWIGKSEKSADKMMAPKPVGRPRQERNDGSEWLREFLINGPRLSTEVETEGKAAGFSYRTLGRAKDDVGIRTFRNDGQWYWQLVHPN